MAKATAKTVDMTNVKDQVRSGINPKRVPEGDYLARIFDVQDAPVKRGDNQGDFQWRFIITLEDYPNGKYPYYCKLQENQLWKVRNLLIAAGITVPRKRLKVDPEKIVGRQIAVTMEDDEYEGKPKSNVAAVFPPANMNGGKETEDEDEEDYEEEEPEPAPRAKRRRPAPEPEPEEAEDEEEYEEEEPEPVAAAPRRRRRRPAPEPEPEVEDEYDEEEDEEPAPPPPPRARKKAAAAPARRRRTRTVTDEELEELDIEDL